MDLLFWPEADMQLAKLERRPALRPLLDAVNETLDRLAEDPFDRRLRTTAFRSDEFAGVYATPVRLENWYVFWQRGTDADEIEIVLIHELDLSC